MTSQRLGQINYEPESVLLYILVYTAVTVASIDTQCTNSYRLKLKEWEIHRARGEGFSLYSGNAVTLYSWAFPLTLSERDY